MPRSAQAPRAGFAARAPEDVAALKAGARHALVGPPGFEHKQALTLSSPAIGAVRMAFSNLKVFHTVWLICERKKLRQEPYGATPAEIAAALGIERRDVYRLVRGLLRNRLLRANTTQTGWQGTLTHYYPAPRAGHALLAMTTTHELGFKFQLGRTNNAYRDRNTDQPHDFIHYAKLYRLAKGGLP